MLMVWVVMEICRPTYPLKIPMMISIALFVAWLFDRRKVFSPQVVLCFLLIGTMLVFTPFAFNNYAAYLTTRLAVIVIVCIAIPMGHFVDSLRRFDALYRTWIAALFYMAIVAVLSGGNGPGGASAGVDQNYTALFLSIGIGFSFFLIPVTKSSWGKLVLLTMIGLSCAGIVIGASRGGFLCMAAVGLFCWWRSPYKLPALVIVVLFAVSVFLAAPEHYWDEMRSIGDTEEGTAHHRIMLWKVAFHMYLDNPIFGVGPGQYPWNFYDYRTEDAGYIVGMYYTHSFYFELLAEMGTVGVLLIAGLVYYNFRDLALVKRICNAQLKAFASADGRSSGRERARQIERIARAQAYANGLSAAFLGFLVGSAFLSTLYYTTFWILTGITVALRRCVINEVRDSLPPVDAVQPSSGRLSGASVESLETDGVSIGEPRRR